MSQRRPPGTRESFDGPTRSRAPQLPATWRSPRRRARRSRASPRRRQPDEEPAAERSRMEPHAGRTGPRLALRRSVEVRGERQAPRKPRAHAHAAVVGGVHAAAEPVRDHHALRAALRAPSRRHAAGRPAPAPADDPRPRRASARLHDGRHRALPVGVAHPLHRMRRQHRHGMGQRRGSDGPVFARHALVQRVDRRAPVDAARRSRHRPREGEVSAGRRRGRRVADAHDSACDGAGRRAWSATGRTARCCGRSRDTPCACSSRACRACRASSGCAGSRSATRRGTRARNRCTTSTSCRAACIGSTRGSRKRRA